MKPAVLASIASVLCALAPAAAAQTGPFAARAAGSASDATPAYLPGVVRLELVGQRLPAYPWFEYTRTCLEGRPLDIAVDPAVHPEIVGRNGYLYVVAHKTPAQWIADPTLVEVRAAAQTVYFGANDVAGNTLPVLFGPIPGNAGTGLGVPYDVVLDFNWNGVLDAGDWIDGLDMPDLEPGFWSVRPTQLAGPLAVTEITYSGGSFLGQNTFYPTGVATLGALPLVVVSHGNGHNYQWYDHVGTHLASYGYVVMSHQNNTGPGIESASTTTLTNTDYFLGNLATIAGGALAGHVDPHRIVWMGHSRGGEGVVRAYDRIVDGTYVPSHFTAADIVLVSSIAPTDFLGPGNSEPHDVDYHLWVGGADSDVTGCAQCTICQSFHLLERAQGDRQSISLHGVGHGAFHNGTGGLVAAGPCQVSRADTHLLMKSYLLPLVAHYAQGNAAARDFLWRQWERFHPPGVPESACVVVDLMYAPRATAKALVVDDFQSEPSSSTSSSGAAVAFDVEGFAEGPLDDPNDTFTEDGSPMNGMTLGGAGDLTAGCTFGWNGADRFLSFAMPGGSVDARAYDVLSFRACQQTRHPLTTAVLGDLTFEVGLRDAHGALITIGIGAYGAGIEEPYQRTGCGTGVGWANEFESIRIGLGDFTRAGSGLDLAEIVAIEFRFGPSHGSTQGRIGLDDVELSSQ